MQFCQNTGDIRPLILPVLSIEKVLSCFIENNLSPPLSSADIIHNQTLNTKSYDNSPHDFHVNDTTCSYVCAVVKGG